MRDFADLCAARNKLIDAYLHRCHDGPVTRRQLVVWLITGEGAELIPASIRRAQEQVLEAL